MGYASPGMDGRDHRRLFIEWPIADVAPFVVKLEGVSLPRFRVGPQMRWEPRIRNRIATDVPAAIARDLASKGFAVSVHLVWGPTGSGKTSLLDWTARSLLRRPPLYINFNSALDENGVRPLLVDIRGAKGPQVVVVDEFEKAPWAGRALLYLIDELKKLGKTGRARNAIVLALLGSTGNSPQELRQCLADTKGGRDVLTRIDHEASVPATDYRDRGLAFLNHVFAHARQNHLPVIHVEKLALLWVCASPALTSGREVATLAHKVIRNLSSVEEYIDFDCVADGGGIRKRFFASMTPSQSRFNNCWITVEDPDVNVRDAKRII